MMTARISRAISGLALAATLLVAGYGTLTGAAVGAAGGAAVGAATGYGAGKGAMIGTGVGAVAGAIYDITQHESNDGD
jgi:osmotically inducible lipoprotein OsmB